MNRLPPAVNSLLRCLAATACLGVAALAVVEPESDIRGAEGVPALLREHRLNPRDTSTSLSLGLELERSGDIARAHEILLEAARFDRQYLPAWTLANFYYRRDHPEHFWTWAARASRLTNDPRPLLRLANRLSPQPRTIVAHLGDRPELLRHYLDLLIAESRDTDVQEVATLLRNHRDPTDLPRLQAVEERLRTIRSAERR